nr:hypothetical protein 25 [bacterium]
MFYGAVPTSCIEQLVKIVDFDSWEAVYLCCSGSFKIERALKASFPDIEIYSNDVSLYSTAIGKLLVGEEFDVTFTGDLEFIEGKLAGSDFLSKTAAILVSFEMARYGKQNNPYAKGHFDYYVENFDTFLEKAKAKLETLLPKMQIAGYFAGDWRKHVETAINNGCGVAAFPPFFKGDYENQFKFVDANIKWDAPTYDLYDPKMLGDIIDNIDASGIPYCILSDQLFEYRKPVLEYVTGRKVPHYCYARTDKSSVRHLYREPEPFHYEPVDVMKLSKKSKVQIVPADSKVMDFIKDVYLQKTIIHSQGVANFLVFIDNMLVGGIIYSLPKFPTFGHNTIYLLSDVTISRDAKLSKLVATIATSKTLLNAVSRKLISRIDYVVTTARTRKPVSMKYRGIYELLNRRVADDASEGNIINYGSKMRSETPQTMYKNWWNKYGKPFQEKRT